MIHAILYIILHLPRMSIFFLEYYKSNIYTSVQNSKFEESRDNLKVVIIDAGETVWSLAFGQHTSQTTGQTRLVLATGLNSGRIRVWEIPSGQ